MRTDVDEAPLKSSVHQDDEVALKWAALERLPTYDRLRRGVLLGLHGGPDEIDVKKLVIDERKALVERLIKTVDENEKLLLKLKDRFERVGIELPTIEVRFEHLNVEVEAYVGTRAASTIPNFITNLAVGFFHSLHVLPSQKKHAQILQNVTGAIKPGRLTLLLGPPSSGKTTLLLALAGRLYRDLKVSGNVTYNGHGMHKLVPQRTAAYVSQYDIHLSELTVRENLAFSARCQGVGSRYETLAELSRREKEAGIQPDPDAVGTEALKDNLVVDYILKILGLEVCADTFVGNEMIRGISGGEKKRLTTGEMLVGPARAMFMDEISTGLDSSTTFQIVNAIRQYIHILKGTAVISLLQPPPETYSLFDDIILLSDGQIVYQGPCENVLEFFSYMGFECPERKAVADFLQEVTSKRDQGQYWGRKDKPYSFVTVKEFGEAFQSFHIGHRLFEELKIPYDKSKSHPAALTTRKYYVRKMELFKTCFSRECLLMKRNAFVHIFKLFQLTISAVMAMTIFLRTRMHKDSLNGGTLYMAALFYNAFRMVFIEISEVSFVVLKLPTFYKQRDLLFFPTWAYALSDWILKLPLTFLATAIWVFMTYYVIGFDPDVGRMFKQYLLLFLVYQMASGLFRFIGAAGRNMIVAQTLGSNVLLLFTVLGGFVLSRENLSKWWIWGYWMSPMMYAQNGIAVNEFLGKSWIQVLPNTTEPLGVIVLKTVGLFPSAYWYWLSVGALAGFSILFNFLYTLALTFLDSPGKPQGVLTENKSSDGEEWARVTTTAVFLESVPSVKAECYSNQPVETRTGMILPFERHCITFNDVRYSIDMPKEMKNQGAIGDRLELLKGLSGAFRPGVLTALMGVTGAGKTTLLDVLAGRKTGGYIEGEIMISGYPKKQETFTRISGYCEQNDVHSPHITIYESLVYSAWLRLSPDVKYETRQMLVEEVMELVELTPLRDALVGLPGVNGLSTEQRKRLTIAVELVANPSIIFMDEPTSGLDARSAAIVMRTVRNTVDTGRTVVCTIHQPSIDIFESFDELFLMKRGGEEIYVGPLGHYSCDLIKYFEGIKGVEKIKNGQNPAAWMLDVTTPAQELRLGVDFAEIYKNSVEYRRTKALVQELSSPSQGSKELSFVSRYPQSFFIQLKACLWKQRCSYWHNPKYTALRLVDTIFVALLLGSMFWGIGSKRRTSQDLFNSMGSIYAAILFLAVRNALFIQTVIFVERTVFYRERAAGMYPALPHTLAQIIIEIPYNLMQTILYSLTVYAMVGYEWVASKVLWFMFFMFFTFLYHTFFGMMAVSMTPNPTFSSIISAFFISVWNLFSGFIVPGPVIPIWWKWYYWACPMAWSLYGLVTSQYGDVKELLEDGVSVQQYLEHGFGYRYNFLGTIAVGVVGYTILFAIVFVFCLKIFNFQKR
ncbi:Pleiotropic drug resistance protein 1-like protein [Drosera capensis]